MADINQLHPRLKAAYENAKAEFIRDNPNGPRPMLTFTYRSKEVQNALYIQGRAPVATVNSIRKAIGLPVISIAEAGRKVTNAKGGQSAHNFLPARAFDVGFVKPDGKMDWSEAPFRKFAPYVLKHTGITWGGHFRTMLDLPHFEVTEWKTL